MNAGPEAGRVGQQPDFFITPKKLHTPAIGGRGKKGRPRLSHPLTVSNDTVRRPGRHAEVTP